MGRNQLEAASHTKPRRANTKPILAFSEQIFTSMGRVMVRPTPTAEPLMAAMTGFFISQMRMVFMPPVSSASKTE